MGVASIPGTEPPADRGTVLAGRICGPTKIRTRVRRVP